MSAVALRRFVSPRIRRHPWVMRARALGMVPQYIAAAVTPTAPRSQIRVCYGVSRLPSLREQSHGGIVKFQHMQRRFPNTARGFNVLYMVSSRRPAGAVPLIALAKRKKARVVWNQDGVAYPAWHGAGWERANLPMKRILHAADFVFYQTAFCKLGADIYLGKRQGPWRILPNCVDTSFFTPADTDPSPDKLVLLLAGTQYQWYRLESALKTLKATRQWNPQARLLVTGRLCWIADEQEARRIALRYAAQLGVADAVTWVGPYTQEEAPAIYRQAHMLLHTKYNDPCPGVVLEAMACGLPVVYSKSGGVPELVGDEAGAGISAPLNWDKDIPPDPEAMAEAIRRVNQDRRRFSQAARERAVSQFDLKPWLAAHQAVFEELLS